MSDKFFEAYSRARTAQLSKNDARRIRTKIDDARNDRLAAVRWPFELLQNAHDAHPRQGRDTISIVFDCRDGNVVFEHDSAPFASADLAALLSGGSGKELESTETTGRFGTGFLSTHVLATRVVVSGLFASEDCLESFALGLDRSGDELAIVQNIEDCNASIRAAIPVTEVDGVPSARFEFHVDNPEAVMLGLDALRDALPYLFSTCLKLGSVELRLPDDTMEQWTSTPSRRCAYADGFIEERLIAVVGRRRTTYRSIRATADADSRAASLLVAERSPHGWHVTIPGDDTPRLYRQFPIRPSSFLQAALVVDAPFEVNQERNRVHLNPTNQAHAREALNAWPTAVAFAFHRQWLGRHRLAQLGLSKTAFAGDADHGFWPAELAVLANAVATMPLVETPIGYLRAVEADDGLQWADFLLPTLSAGSSGALIDIGKFWPVANDVTDVAPPIENLAREWCDIALQWRTLGVPVRIVTMESVANEAKAGAGGVDDLNVDGDPLEWVARFVDVVGACWAAAGSFSPSIFDGLLPDQHGKLRSPKDLARDCNISDSLKDTARLVGYDVRAKLLHGAVGSIATSRDLKSFVYAMDVAIPAKIDEQSVIDTCLNDLDRRLPVGKVLTEAGLPLLAGSIRLLDHIWTLKGDDGRVLAHRCPFVAQNRYLARCSAEPATTMMAPVKAWHAAAQPFAAIYSDSRILHPDYQGDASRGVPSVVEPLVRWAVAHADPLITDLPQKLEAERLRAIAESASDAIDVTVSNQALSQIALLNEVIPRCETGEAREKTATSLLGLVLCHIARNDSRWRQFTTVKGKKKSAGDVELRIRCAHWLAHLRVRSWVPVRTDNVESGKPSSLPATAATLRPFLELHSEWLKDNPPAVELLSECFGFDALELRLLGITADDDTRRKLRSGLAKIIEATGAHPELLDRLAEKAVESKAQASRVRRLRDLGLAVQDAIRESLVAHGLTTNLVDRGFDYEVAYKFTEAADEDEIGVRITVGSSYLLEVKATTVGEAKMTPTQARTASLHKMRYVLCVVDLRSVPQDTLDRSWTAADVEPLARLITDIGANVEVSWNLVEKARGSAVALRNDDVLRYAVPDTLWNAGVSIAQWTASLADRGRDSPTAALNPAVTADSSEEPAPEVGR